jgi:telomerase reverse transcriptase
MGDLHPRLKAFKERLNGRSSILHNKPTISQKLYFVKLDIQACFDNIPQKRLLRLITDLVTEESYRITKHVEIKPSVNGAQGKPFRKWVGRAAPLKQQQHLPDYLASENQIQKPNTVYVDDNEQKIQDADWLLNLLGQHVQNNLVKIGKEYFRQRNGIPQGSVLSSLLCNFFLADLERHSLGFLQPTDSLLMRFVDDFLLVTTDVNQAMQFLHTMLDVDPSYSVVVNPSKSLVNFTASIGGTHIPRLEGSTRFPYLGCLIDTHTLEIHQDQDRALEGGDLAATALSNSLTVETSALPGHTLRRKVLASFRQQMHPMFIDDTHNSRSVVLGNLYSRFVTVAMIMSTGSVSSQTTHHHPNHSHPHAAGHCND